MNRILSLIALFVCVSMAFAQEKSYHFTNETVLNKAGTGNITKLIVLMPIPQSNEYQAIDNLTWSDGNVLTDKNFGNLILRLDKLNLFPNQYEYSYKLTSSFDVSPKKIDFDFSKITELKDYDVTSKEYRLFLGDRGEYIVTSHPYIVSVGDALWEKTGNILDYARLCYEYVAANFRYINGNFRTLQQILNEGGGECGDFTTLVVNLLRYKGIPSRHNICLRLDGGYHVWADFYLEGYGWIPLDATYKNSNRSGDYFGKYPGDCVVVAQDLDYEIDGISELWFLQSFCYWYWCSGNVDLQAYHKTDIIENSGVECVSTQEESADVYNLQGIKVSPEYKGIVISKGKLRIRK